MKKRALLKGDSFAVSRDSQHLVTVQADNKRGSRVVVRNVKTGTLLLTIGSSKQNDRPMSAIVSEDGRTVYTGTYRGEIAAWDARTGDRLFTIDTVAQWIAHLDLSADGLRLLIKVNNSSSGAI